MNREKLETIAAVTVGTIADILEIDPEDFDIMLTINTKDASANLGTLTPRDQLLLLERSAEKIRAAIQREELKE